MGSSIPVFPWNWCHETERSTHQAQALPSRLTDGSTADVHGPPRTAAVRSPPETALLRGGFRNATGSCGPDVDVLAPAPTRSSPTRPAAPSNSAPTCANAASSATIPEKADQQRQRHNRGSRGGRPPAYGPRVYRRRNVVERCFNRLKGFRGIATRYDKTATSYEVAVSFASILLWARSFEDGPPSEPSDQVRMADDL